MSSCPGKKLRLSRSHNFGLYITPQTVMLGGIPPSITVCVVIYGTSPPFGSTHSSQLYWNRRTLGTTCAQYYRINLSPQYRNQHKLSYTCCLMDLLHPSLHSDNFKICIMNQISRVGIKWFNAKETNSGALAMELRNRNGKCFHCKTSNRMWYVNSLYKRLVHTYTCVHETYVYICSRLTWRHEVVNQCIAGGWCQSPNRKIPISIPTLDKKHICQPKCGLYGLMPI